LICVGGIISTSSIMGVTQQAGHDESTDAADAGCAVVPILYALGWTIQYGSLCAKTLRLRRVVEKSSGAMRTKITVWQTSHAIFIPLLVDAAILTAWTVVNPLEYVRSEEGRSFEDGVVTIESIGRCRPSNEDGSVWFFLGPLFANHLFLIAWTHYSLWQVRNVNNRYQENKYLGMAAIFALEVAIVGIPILIAAQDSVEATFFVITGIVALDNIGILCFVFVPKMFFQMKGLEEGVTVGESVLKDTHKQSVLRESGRMLSSSVLVSEEFRSRSKSPKNSSGDNLDSGVLPSIAEMSEEDDYIDVPTSNGNDDLVSGLSASLSASENPFPSSGAFQVIDHNTDGKPSPPLYNDSIDDSEADPAATPLPEAAPVNAARTTANGDSVAAPKNPMTVPTVALSHSSWAGAALPSEVENDR